MTIYRIGGKPAARIGRMLGITGVTTLAEYATKAGDCYSLAVSAAAMSIAVDVTKPAEIECGDPRDFVCTVRYTTPARKCAWQFEDCQQIASENAAQADEHLKEWISDNYAYRIGVAHVSFVSEDYRYLRSIGRRSRRI